VIGYEESSQLDVEPAKYFVLVTKREKHACKSCEEQGVVSAPLPPRIIEKCLASDQIVIDTVISKYCDHTPLYRQSAILQRDTGLELSRATLDGWVLKVGELLIPMASAMRQELINGRYIQADETPVDVQMHEGRRKNHQAYLWQYSRPEGTVVFDFRLGRGRDGPRQFLGKFEGLLQTDGYAAYDQIGGPKIVHAACWSHAERYFSEVVQLNPQDPVATPIVARIDPVEHEVTIRFDERLVKYDFGELDEVALAYAITIHKSQGSEFPAVVIPLATQHYMLLQRNLIYTGITRGKRLLVLIGQKKALGIAVRKTDRSGGIPGSSPV
jgi:transposase